MEQLQCSRCNKFFSYERTLKRHLITCGSQKNVICIKCPDVCCSKLFTNKKLLKLHIEVDHSVQLHKEQKRFATFQGKCNN